MLVLPGDLKRFGCDPDEYSIAKAVRMSMSLPGFFEPFKLKDADGKEHIIVDGGLLSNYPIWLLDDNSKNPPWPTVGFKFSTDLKDDQEPAPSIKPVAAVKGLFNYAKSVLSTMLDAHDKYHISTSNGDFERTILISTKLETDGARKQINTTDFDITREESDELFSNGYRAAEKFLAAWDFDEWVQKYRV
jgi:NTE family protein